VRADGLRAVRADGLRAVRADGLRAVRAGCVPSGPGGSRGFLAGWPVPAVAAVARSSSPMVPGCHWCPRCLWMRRAGSGGGGAGTVAMWHGCGSAGVRPQVAARQPRQTRRPATAMLHRHGARPGPDTLPVHHAPHAHHTTRPGQLTAEEPHPCDKGCGAAGVRAGARAACFAPRRAARRAARRPGRRPGGRPPGAPGGLTRPASPPDPRNAAPRPDREPGRCHIVPVRTGSPSQRPGPGQAPGPGARDSRAGSDTRDPGHRGPGRSLSKSHTHVTTRRVRMRREITRMVPGASARTTRYFLNRTR
jgi:hypothetical protein